MTPLLLQMSPNGLVGPCALCGRQACLPAGLQLIASAGQPVCLSCARKHAAALVALVQLADEAARVGRIGRHTVFPPYTALLDLARAADHFAAAAPRPEAA
jgi:hypothetical protein